MHLLIVDDHQLFREGLKLLLEDLIPKCRFSEAYSCESARRFSSEVPVDMILLDVKLPDGMGFSAMEALRELHPRAVIVVLSGENDAGIVERAISLGASGFIPKDTQPEAFGAALELVISGGVYLPPEIVEQTIPAASAIVAAAGEDGSSPVARSISKRQRDVLMLAVQGLANKEIARSLNITESTVKAHLSASFKLLGVRNRTQAVYAVARHGIA